MQLMEHGAVAATTSTPEDDSFVLPLGFDMAGEWQIDLLIRTEEQEKSLLLYVDMLD